LPHLQAWTHRRQEIAAEYNRILASVQGISLPRVADGREHVYHLYVIEHEGRDALMAHLTKCGVQSVINYPRALPFLPAYERMGHAPSDFPNAHRSQSRILSLPIFPEMTNDQISVVASALRGF
jgi:dTDP-4-amino-4,6-dideoxygalactose transaminase